MTEEKKRFDMRESGGGEDFLSWLLQKFSDAVLAATSVLGQGVHSVGGISAENVDRLVQAIADDLSNLLQSGSMPASREQVATHFVLQNTSAPASIKISFYDAAMMGTTNRAGDAKTLSVCPFESFSLSHSDEKFWMIDLTFETPDSALSVIIQRVRILGSLCITGAKSSSLNWSYDSMGCRDVPKGGRQIAARIQKTLHDEVEALQ